MSKTLFRQCNLRSGESVLTCWLDAKVQKGWKVTLKDSEDPEKWWEVMYAGETMIPRDEIHDEHKAMDWHKNDFLGKLTGLDIKK